MPGKNASSGSAPKEDSGSSASNTASWRASDPVKYMKCNVGAGKRFETFKVHGINCFRIVGVLLDYVYRQIQ